MTMAGSTLNCFLCNEPGSFCSDCDLVNHCPLHQDKHKGSGGVCYPFTILYGGPDRGHFMEAVRDIKTLEVILSEDPVVVGPYTETDSLQCIECFSFSLLNGNYSNCESCNFPLCNKKCSNGPNHEQECQLFKRWGLKFLEESKNGSFYTYYAAIMVTRLLNLKTQEPDIFKRFLKLEDHKDKRKEEEPELWRYHDQYVVKCLTEECNVEFSSEEIESVLGKMFTNCGDLQLPPGSRGCGFYPVYANMNHSCLCNTKTLKYPNQRLEVRAQVSIAKGSEISTQYIQSMKGTYARRPILRSKWYFDCLCPRCLDPTECGSYLSALLCTKANRTGVIKSNGFVRPHKLCGGVVVPFDPLVGESVWQCQYCQCNYPVEQVIEVVSQVSKDLSNALSGEDSVQHLERVIHKSATLLHPSHYLLIDAKQSLSFIYGNFPPYVMATLPRHLKERKVQLCQDMLDTISKVDPGYTKTRGQLLAEQNKTKMIIVKEDIEKTDQADENRKMVNNRQLERAMLEKKFLHMYLAYYQSIFHGKSKR